jgi:hypothetical protein
MDLVREADLNGRKRALHPYSPIRTRPSLRTILGFTVRYAVALGVCALSAWALTEWGGGR